MGTPFFSIIVPIFNTPPDFLKECISSLTGQTCPELEIILINDGSTEDCAKQCRELSGADSRILLLEQEHLGVSAARNHGMRRASGKWILFVDSDDWLEPDALETIRGYISLHEFDILVFNCVLETKGRFSDQGREGDTPSCALDHGFLSGMHCTDDADIKELVCRKAVGTFCEPGKKEAHNYALLMWDKAYRKAWLDKHGLSFHEKLFVGEDSLFILQCMEKVRNVYCVDRILYHHRKNDHSVTMNLPQDTTAQRRLYAAATFPIVERICKSLADMRNGRDTGALYKDYCSFLFMLMKTVILRLCGNGKQADIKSLLKSAAFAFSKEMRPALTLFPDDKKEIRIEKNLLRFGLIKSFLRRRKPSGNR